MTRIGVVIFPGSNCEYDAALAMTQLGVDVEFVWHSRPTSRASTGSSCRADSPTATTCARARSPASRRSWRPSPASPPTGGPVLGICNGFQVLTEAGLLPGALQKNRGLTFISEPTPLVVESTNSVLTRLGDDRGQELDDPDQPLLGRLHLRRRDARGPRGQRPGRAALPGQPQRLARRHRRVSPTRPATWWASCRTPSARCRRCSAAPTAGCCLAGFVSAPERPTGERG
jgi:hypothetical protein